MNVLKKVDAALSVKHEAGWNANVSSRWSNAGALSPSLPPRALFLTLLALADLDPVPKAQRTWTGWDICSYWISDQCA